MAEVGRDGKIRWQVGNLKYPVDAIVLPGERVLVTEWDGNRVAEWDFKRQPDLEEGRVQRPGDERPAAAEREHVHLHDQRADRGRSDRQGGVHGAT